MDPRRIRAHRLANIGQTLLLIAAIAAVLGAAAWSLGGPRFAGLALIGGLLMWMVVPTVSPRLVMQLYRARPLRPEEAPVLYDVLGALARRADLARVPVLHYVPSNVMNAFAVGSRDQGAIAVSDGLLRRLTLPEIAAILAHELTHIRYGDTRLMGLADVVSRITGLLSSLGFFLALVNLPFLLLGFSLVNWWTIAILMSAPIVVALIQLALSRTREYDADLGAAEILGETAPLMSALKKLEQHRTSAMRRLFWPIQRLPDPCLLRTHPPTDERLRRLGRLRPDAPPLAEATGRATAVSAPAPPPGRAWPLPMISTEPIRPRRRASGTWY